jgi:hypothetical protein
MTISEHVDSIADLRVVDWEPGEPDLAKDTAYRIAISYEDAEQGASWTERFSQLLETPGAGDIEGLVVGPWGEVGAGTSSAEVVEALCGARAKLPNLRALFLGDIVLEESEISWIQQSDISRLFPAYKRLEYLRVRGGNDLELGTPHHEQLKTLIIESGGLPVGVVRSVCKAQLPALEHLELWLGDEGYGADATVSDLQPLLTGKLLPKLRYLGLRDSYIQDEVAAAVAASPLLARLEILDLSLGNLSDAGAKKLLAAKVIGRLKKLDLHHHYVSESVAKKLAALGIEVDLSERQIADHFHGEEHRYVAVSE